MGLHKRSLPIRILTYIKQTTEKSETYSVVFDLQPLLSKIKSLFLVCCILYIFTYYLFIYCRFVLESEYYKNNTK